VASTSTSSRWRQPQLHKDSVNLNLTRWRQPQLHQNGVNLNFIKISSTSKPTKPSTLANRDEYIYSKEFTRLVAVKRKEATTDKKSGCGTSCKNLQADRNITNSARQQGTFFQQLAISGQTYYSPAQLYSASRKHKKHPGYSHDKQQNGSYAITIYYPAEN
jgi:hypothetical protein